MPKFTQHIGDKLKTGTQGSRSQFRAVFLKRPEERLRLLVPRAVFVCKWLRSPLWSQGWNSPTGQVDTGNLPLPRRAGVSLMSLRPHKKIPTGSLPVGKAGHPNPNPSLHSVSWFTE